MPATWRAGAVGLDVATTACAAFNLGYFVYRLARCREETASRAVAVLALALVSLAAMGESLFFLASLTVLPVGSPPASVAWTVVRVLPLAGTAFITILIVRRLLAAIVPEGGRP